MSNATGTPAAERVECRKCHRALTSPASRLAGIGPRCAAIEAATEGLTPKQVDKMKQVLLDNGVEAAGDQDAYFVANEADGVIRTAHLDGTCDCEWGRRRKSADVKVCYHVAAARLFAKPVIRRTLRRAQLAKAA